MREDQPFANQITGQSITKFQVIARSVDDNSNSEPLATMVDNENIEKTEMSHIRRGWHYVMAEPFTWLFYAFFQPGRFKREYESRGIVNRLVSMLRLSLPLFLCCYPLALLMLLLGRMVPGNIDSLVMLSPEPTDTMTGSGIFQFLLAIALMTGVSIAWSVLWGTAGGIAGGIAWAIVLSSTGSIGSVAISGTSLGVSSIVGSFGISTIYGLRHCIVLGILGGIVGGIARLPTARRKNIRKDVLEGIMGGTVAGIAAGLAGDIVASIALNVANIMPASRAASVLSYLAMKTSIASLLAGSITGGIAKSIVEKRGTTIGKVAGVIGSIVGGIVGLGALSMDLLSHSLELSAWEWGSLVAGTVLIGIIGGIVGGTVLTIVEMNGGRKGIKAAAMMIIAGTLLSGVSALSITSTMGVAAAIAIGNVLGVVRPSMLNIVLVTALAIGRIEKPIFLTPEGIRGGLIVDTVLIVSFIVGYYRLPLYPISAISTLRAYLASLRNPSGVFANLRGSSLYWDEYVMLPLPGLKKMLLLAAVQHVERTLEEITFIIAERRQQIHAALAASREIAIRDLEERVELHEIAQASQRLTDLLPQEVELIDPRWLAPFARLHDASRDAARACSPLGWQARRLSLQEMITSLKKVHPNTAFKDAQLNMRLGEVVKTWRDAAQRGLETLEYAPEKTSRVDNPYNPGPSLELHDSLFVGRHDLAQQLGDALARGSRRPTFLLHGERRMGKSSTLKQLPDLLGARYLPIFYDLQMRGFSANIAIFLGKVAEEISRTMSMRGLPTRKLPYEQLQEASRRGETEVYYQFERWLELVEPILEQADRTVLLAFDEFEKLEDAGRRGQIDLPLLLDWFRSVIQNHPRLALLFSGVRSFEDMGTNWAGYFVNVQTLKVSFLQSTEAYQLITRPVPRFPAEQIFGERVVEAIMQMTNCHPFLVQALCSALIDDLNARKRTRLELLDVVTAADQVLKNWGSTYFRDQWERTDKDQQAYIMALAYLGKSDLPTLIQHCGRDTQAARRVLDTLIDRDIVLCEQGSYRIAVHLFRHWIERNR